MRGFLLDTNVVSELRKKHRPNHSVLDWFSNHQTASLWLSVLVVGELRLGIERIERREGRSADALRSWLDLLTSSYQQRMLPVDVAVAERWAQLSVPDPLPVIDGLLAATAIEHDLTLVTRNVRDFERTGVDVVNPFG